MSSIFKTGLLLVRLILIMGVGFSVYPQRHVEVAFMADVHLLDVYGTFNDLDYKSFTTKDGKNAIIRTMDAQLHSTRLFNENYFAFKAALDKVVERNIKYVALPGDFSDDGQPLNIHGLNSILNAYTSKYGLQFLLITGNHDPTRPFGKAGGKTDFLAADGKAQPIMSEAELYTFNPDLEHPTLISEDIREMGYEEIVNTLNEHGFFPKKEYHYWATPFSTYTYETYSLSKAHRASKIKNRYYRFGNSKIKLPDVSYIVEPIEGLWLLALDANVHLPNKNGKGYSSAGIGFNRVVEHKKYLIEWIKAQYEQAQKHNKTLIAFSHYPMIDFNDGASPEIAGLFGKKAFQSYRNPKESIAEKVAETGLKIHVGGHMHLNDTGLFKSKNDNTLVNIQVPSLAGYPPAFKVLKFGNAPFVEVETVVLDSVAGFNSFFDAYKKEHDFLTQNVQHAIWDKKILAAKNYRDYTLGHLKNLVELSFLPSVWPKKLKTALQALNGLELVALSQIDEVFDETDLNEVVNGNKTGEKWQNTLTKARELIKINSDTLQDYINLKGSELIFDLYKLRNADNLAKSDIPKKRLDQYQLIIKGFGKNQNPVLTSFQQLAHIFEKQLHGTPAINFKIDLQSGEIINLD